MPTYIASHNVALTVNDPSVKVPYTKISIENVRGWPNEVPLIHPRTLTLEQLKLLESNIDKIEFIGTYVYFTCIHFHT